MPYTDDKVLVQSWIRPELAARLRDRAAAAERSVAGELRNLLRNALEGEEPAGGRLSNNHAVAGGSDVLPR